MHFAEQFTFNFSDKSSPPASTIMDVSEFMAGIARLYHDEIHKQTRKYSGLPYSTHPDGVAEIYAKHFPGDLVGKGIAHGHDLFEDTSLTPEVLAQKLYDAGFSLVIVHEIVNGISYLTDEFTKEKYPHLSRAERKAKQAQKLGEIPAREQNIKLSDLIHNTADIVANDPKFAKTYLKEKLAILEIFAKVGKVDFELFSRAVEQVSEGMKKIS